MHGLEGRLTEHPYISLYILEILNGCILFIVIIIIIIIIIIGLINTKLEDFVKLGELFLTIINISVLC